MLCNVDEDADTFDGLVSSPLGFKAAAVVEAAVLEGMLVGILFISAPDADRVVSESEAAAGATHKLGLITGLIEGASFSGPGA
jgi:hypothetical protein